jgi:citrate lyase subunit beta/citryl-CoA lyase
MIEPRPLRSLLFVPGTKERWVEPARASGADGIVFDLQDSVLRPEAGAARDVVARVLDRSDATFPQLFVRVSAPGTPDLAGDLEAVVRPGLTGIMVPGVGGPEDVRQVAEQIDALEIAGGMTPGSTILMPLIESAAAARCSYEIASASNRIAHMGAGTAPEGDFARDVGFRWTPGGTETLMVRSLVLLNVRAANVRYPISGTWGRIDDLVGLQEFAEQTRGLGYEGLMVLHPSQVPTVNATFSPSPADIERWQDIIVAMREASERGVGVVRFQGRVIDEAHLKTAKESLRRAEYFGLVSSRTSRTP